MILVTGGAFQGKLDFAKALLGKDEPRVVEGEELLLGAAPKEIDIVSHLQLYIRGLLEEGKSPKQVGRQVLALAKSYPGVILEVTELGCGVVPVESFDRMYQETVGRISCELAKLAEAVYRVTCGIGQRIK